MYKLKLYLNYGLYLYVSVFLFIISLNTFSNECPQGTYPVKGYTRTEYYRGDGTHVSAAKVSEHCRNYRKLSPPKIVFKEKMPEGWPHKKEVFKKWTEEEKEQIRKAITKLPKILTHIGSIILHRANRSEAKNNPATSAPEEKIIVIYDNGPDPKIERVIAHELSHILYTKYLSDDEIDAYEGVARWQKVNNIFVVSRNKFTAEDGKTSPEEDFSNNIEFYLFEKDKLKENKEIYQWIKEFMEKNDVK